MERNDEPLRLIDVAISEVDVADDPASLPDRGVDRGVVPQLMAEYLRYAEHFPVAPTLTFENGRFRAIDGGRCLWAGRKAGWNRSVRCVIRGGPAEVTRRSMPFTSEAAEDDAPSTWMLFFDRIIDEQQRLEIESLLVAITGSAHFLWDGKTVRWQWSYDANPEDRTIGNAWFGFVQRAHAYGLIAVNGRRAAFLSRN